MKVLVLTSFHRYCVIYTRKDLKQIFILFHHRCPFLLPFKVVITIPCYHPLTAIIDPNRKTINGKKSLRIVDPLTDLSKVPPEYVVKLPCGQCVGCRIQYSREWANRCMMELQYHDSAYFVTLTYDDAHVPVNDYVVKDVVVDSLNGEVLEEPEIGKSLSLYKRDFQLFMKRLRKKFCNDEIRFFMAGEYGSNTVRPHYHAIIYGLHLDDLSLYKKSPQGFSYYNSPSLSTCWIDTDARYPGVNYHGDGLPLGFCVVADVTWESCAYTARYIMKKLNGKEAEFYRTFNMQPEFTLMSRKPGIAKKYFEDHPNIYDSDFIHISTEKGGLKFRPPRYFDKLYDLEHPDELEEIKSIRAKLAVEAQKAKLQRTSLSPDELLAVEERAFEDKIKSLRRDIV